MRPSAIAVLRKGRRATRPIAALAGSAASAVLVLAAGSAPAMAQTATGLQSVTYAGYHFAIPATWPVFGLSRQPLTCVRFDLHAVYLGSPGATEKCPSWLLGATEAIVISPGSGSARRQTVENPLSHQIWASAPGIAVTATFDTDPAVITDILASAGLAPAVVTTAARTGTPGASLAPPGSPPSHGAATELTVSATSVPLPPLPASVADDVGLGFDTCTAPSSDAMQAWLANSSYRAVGIYIGGADRACSQPNLTADWVRQQATAGWHFIPLYAGPQSAFGQITAPAQQGASDASDAVAQAEQLGFGPGTPLYYDMESYLPAQSASTLQFLSAWTVQLHILGYDSGVYSSSNSGIADLAAQYKSGHYAMPDVIYDALWNGAADTNDSNYQPGEWSGGQRIHQFSGNVQQSFGGVTMLIDQDYLDVTLAPAAPSPQPSPTASPQPSSSPTVSPQPSSSASPQPSSSPTVSPQPSLPAATAQASAAVTNGNGSTFVFAVGPGHHLIEQATTGDGGWTRTDLGGYLTSAPSAVLVGSAVDVFYRGAGHRLWELAGTSAGFGPAKRFGQFGPVGVPEAVAQANGVIDLFWRGYGGSHLWHAQYDPGSGWAGPQDLQGHLASDPYPVVTPAGDLQVFWTGAGDRNLWRDMRGGMSGRWGSPQNLGMGPLDGAPAAVALANGEVDVFWRRLIRPRFLEMAVFQRGGPASGPVNPGGALGALLPPWPVLAAGNEWLVFQGRLGGLRQVHAVADGGWSASVWVRGVAGLQSAPFAAAGPASAPLEVFWTGTDGHLWEEQFTPSGDWSPPVQLGAL